MRYTLLRYMKRFIIILISLILLIGNTFANTKDVNISQCLFGGNNLNHCAMYMDDFDCRTDKEFWVKFWSGTAGYVNCIEFNLENDGTHDKIPHLFSLSGYDKFAFIDNGRGVLDEELRIYRPTYINNGSGNYTMSWTDRTDTIDLSTPSARYQNFSLYSREKPLYNLANTVESLVETNLPEHTYNGSVWSETYEVFRWLGLSTNFTGYYGNLLSGVPVSHSMVQTADYIPNIYHTLEINGEMIDEVNQTYQIWGGGEFEYTGENYSVEMFIDVLCKDNDNNITNQINDIVKITWYADDNRTETEKLSDNEYIGQGYTSTDKSYYFSGVTVPYFYPNNCTYPYSYVIYQDTENRIPKFIVTTDNGLEIIPTNNTSNIEYEQPPVEEEYTGIFSGVVNWFKNFVNNLIDFTPMKNAFDTARVELSNELKQKAPFKYVYDIFNFDWSDIQESSTLNFNFTAFGQTMLITGTNTFTNAILPTAKFLFKGLLSFEFVIVAYYLFKSLL